MLARVVVLAVVCFINTETAVFQGKGLFCRDPDTGMLHPINETWSSTTFCGNYICKLRKSNETVVQEPIREFNVTDLNFKATSETIKNSTGNVENIEETPDFRIVIPELRTKIPKKQTLEDHTNFDDDRYLTENEIQSITNELYKVKKSDVDALVEVYTLAQEIYHEMDKVTEDEKLNESVNNFKESIQSLDTKNINNQNGKARDMEPHSTISNSNSLYLTNTVKKEIINNNKYPSYFNGPLTMRDFRKIPYYYPISAFQRMSSYVHQPNRQLKIPESTPFDPATRKEEIIQSPTAHVDNKDHQKLIKPSHLLPYPFSYVNKYNLSKYTNMYSSNPWVWDYYYKINKQSPYLKAYLARIPQYTEAILVNPHLQDEEVVQDIEQPVKKTHIGSFIKKDEPRKPKLLSSKILKDEPWKTKPLSSQIINEIKANIDTHRIKAFPFRKKVKIEKVGKVIKMDESIRTRRDTNTIDNLEKKEKVDNLEKQDRVDSLEKQDIVDNLEKQDRVDNLEKQDRVDNLEKQDRVDNLEKQDRVDKLDKLPKSSRPINEIDNSKKNEVVNAKQRMEKPLPIHIVEGKYEAIIERITCQPQVVPGYFRYGNLTEPYPRCCPQLIGSR